MEEEDGCGHGQEVRRKRKRGSRKRKEQSRRSGTRQSWEKLESARQLLKL